MSALTPESSAQDAAVRVEKIEVTGSNVKRVDGETGLPVTTITRGEIERSGVTTAAELIDRVSAASAGGHSIAQSLGDGGRPGLSAASLRGLGSNNTLVLLNGHRLANYAFNAVGGGTVNLNQIPFAAVERVEILKDGASAIYGTDAIGGVINFILRKDYQGAEAAASASGTSRGGGSSDRYTATLGFGDVNRSGFNVLALVDYQKDKPLGASQRAFAAAPDVAVAVRTDGLPLHVAARVQEKAAEGMTALRRYVWITRGMHELDLRALLADEGTR